MFKKTVTLNVEYLDTKISLLISELDSDLSADEYRDTVSKLDSLVKLRSDLANSRDRESMLPIVVSGLIQSIGIFAVLHYEKTDVVTSKAFNMATNLFKGSR